MLGLAPREFVTFAQNTWKSVIRARPEITPLLYPIMSWLFADVDDETARQAHAVALTAPQVGQLELTGTGCRRDVDLLGTVLTIFRSKSALQARGQYYTPLDITNAIVRLTGVEERCVVTDPVMGTGGMFRAAAEVMRQQGRDPHTIRWIGGDIDELAVACATVNSMIWNLGDDIVFHAGNTLAENWEARALAQREELRSLASQVSRHRQIMALLQDM